MDLHLSKKQRSIKDARERRGFTIDGVSGVLGIHPSELARYEKYPENVPVGIAVNLAKLYGVSINDLCFLDV